MLKKTSNPLGLPQTAGAGFVLGVAIGLLLGGAGGLIAFSAAAGTLVLPLLRVTPILRLVRRLAATPASFVP